MQWSGTGGQATVIFQFLILLFFLIFLVVAELEKGPRSLKTSKTENDWKNASASTTSAEMFFLALETKNDILLCYHESRQQQYISQNILSEGSLCYFRCVSFIPGAFGPISDFIGDHFSMFFKGPVCGHVPQTLFSK